MTSSITRHRFAALFISVTIVVFLLYGLLLEKHYALDTYIVETQGKLWLQHIALGRFVSAALLKLCASLGINTATEQSIFTFGAIFSLSSAVSLLVVFFSPLVRNHNNSTFLFLCLACLSSLCNLFVLHWFLFPEVVFIITLGLLLAVTTLFCLRLPGWKSWPASSLLLFLALSCYQAVGAFFVIFALLYFSCLQQKTSLWITVRGYGKTLCIYFMAGLTNIALVRWCGISDERTAFQQTDLFHNAMAILANLQHKLQTTGLGNTPVVVFVFCISVLLFLALLFLRQGRSKRAEIPALPHLFFLLFCAIGITFGPHLLTSTVDISPRSIAALMSLPAVLSLFIFFQAEPGKKPVVVTIFQLFLFIFFLINATITYRVELSRLATNRMDRQIATAITKEVIRHEQQTGEKITKIAFRHDIAPAACYPNELCYGNFRAMGREISVIPLLFLTSGKRYFRVPMPERIYQQYFKGKNWDTFSKDQLKIEKDTLYLMLY